MLDIYYSCGAECKTSVCPKQLKICCEECKEKCSKCCIGTVDCEYKV